jgi:hypothetical protein
MNPPEYYDEITRLRLRLAEVELQRDAFKAMADKAVTDLIREVLQKEKPKETDWAALGSTYYTYDPKDAASLRQDDKVSTYTVNGKEVSKEQYDLAKEQEHIVAALDSITDRLIALEQPKPAKRKRRG